MHNFILNRLANLKLVAITDKKKILTMVRMDEVKSARNPDTLEDTPDANYIRWFRHACTRKKVIFYYGHRDIPEILNSPCDLSPQMIVDYNEHPKLWDALQKSIDDNSYQESNLTHESILNFLNIPNVMEEDGYGGIIFLHKHIMYSLLNVYGEEDYYPIHTLFCFCFINHEDKELNVFDIVIEGKKLKLKNHCIGHIPEKVYKFWMGFAKRGFYFDRDRKIVSIRYDPSYYKHVPIEFKHKEAESWSSAPRVIIPVTSV